MTIWCVLGFCHPNLIDDIRSNFYCQKYQDKRLVIVENGKGIGKWVKSSDQEYVLQSKFTGESKPLNEGIKLVKEIGKPEDWWTKWDDDDLYLPNYLQSVIDAPKDASVVGRSSVWIRDEFGELWFCNGPSNCYADKNSFPRGPTIVAKIDCPFFPEIGNVGNDSRWVSIVKSMGLKIWLNPAGGFIWRRFGPEHNHVWMTGIDAFRTAIGSKIEKVISGNPENDLPEKTIQVDINIDFEMLKKEMQRIM